jgi:acylphosphatase
VAVVHGLVQGVGFRWFVLREADDLALVGWVRNQADGSVEIVAEGPDDRLDRLLALVQDGPPGAFVSRVDARREPARGDLADFSIRSGWHSGD